MVRGCGWSSTGRTAVGPHRVLLDALEPVMSKQKSGFAARAGAVVVPEPRRMNGRPDGGVRSRHVGAGEFGVETHLRRCRWRRRGPVGVFPVRDEEDVGLVRTDDARQGVARVEGVFEAAVWEVEKEPLHTAAAGGGAVQGGEGVPGFEQAGVPVAARRGAAVGEVDDEDVVPLRGEARDGAAHADLGVVGVSGDDEDVRHVGGVFRAGAAKGVALIRPDRAPRPYRREWGCRRGRRFRSRRAPAARGSPGRRTRRAGSSRRTRLGTR